MTAIEQRLYTDADVERYAQAIVGIAAAKTEGSR